VREPVALLDQLKAGLGRIEAGPGVNSAIQRAFRLVASLSPGSNRMNSAPTSGSARMPERIQEPFIASPR
jgi:hypothetical protein